MLKTKISGSTIFLTSINVIVLILFAITYMDRFSSSSVFLNYSPLIASSGILIYISNVQIIEAYSIGIKFKYLFNLFREPKCITYEDIIGVTFTSNRRSDLMVLRYIEDEKIISTTITYSLQENEITSFTAILNQNKIMVKGIS